MVDDKDLGKAIQKLRGDRTQKHCAIQARISASSWSLYESGNRSPRGPMRERIALGLGVDVRTLEEEAWKVRNERLANEQAAQKAGAAAAAITAPPISAEAAGPDDPLRHAIDEHVNGVAHHLRELILLANRR